MSWISHHKKLSTSIWWLVLLVTFNLYIINNNTHALTALSSSSSSSPSTRVGKTVTDTNANTSPDWELALEVSGSTSSQFHYNSPLWTNWQVYSSTKTGERKTKAFFKQAGSIRIEFLEEGEDRNNDSDDDDQTNPSNHKFIDIGLVESGMSLRDIFAGAGDSMVAKTSLSMDTKQLRFVPKHWQRLCGSDIDDSLCNSQPNCNMQGFNQISRDHKMKARLGILYSDNDSCKNVEIVTGLGILRVGDNTDEEDSGTITAGNLVDGPGTNDQRTRRMRARVYISGKCRGERRRY